MEAGTVAPAAASTGSKTIADLMALAAERHGAHEAQRSKRDGEWHSVSYEELGRIVSEIARGLIGLGIAPGDRVSLLCSTRAEWTSCDFAISSAGAVVVPVYPTNSPSECEWVAGNSESVAIVCEDAEQVAKIVAVRGNLPALKHVVVIDPSGQAKPTASEARPTKEPPGES
jgi:long-chain acyl-CoA synthetase